jgi:putative ABC transport system permease protein
MKLLPLAIKNIFRKRTRSILTMASIILPLFVICFLGTMIRTLEADPTGGKGMFRLIVRHKVSLANFFPEAYREPVKQMPGVQAITVLNWFGGQYIDNKPKNMFSRFGVEPETFLQVADEIKVADGTAQDWIGDRRGAMVGRLLAKRYGWKLGDQFILKGDIFPTTLELTVRAIYEGPDETAVYFNRKYIEEAVPWAKGQVGTLWIKADSPEAVSRLTRMIDERFENTSYPTKTETEKEFQNGFVSMLGNVKLVLNAISLAIGLVILLIAANTMAMAARERVTEIAVLRTLGFQKQDILTMVLAESLLMSLFGGLLGLGLFSLAFPGFRQGLLESPMGGFAAGMRLFPEVLIVGFAITVSIGLAAGLVPAIRSAQRGITDGLRQVA